MDSRELGSVLWHCSHTSVDTMCHAVLHGNKMADCLAHQGGLPPLSELPTKFDYAWITIQRLEEESWFECWKRSPKTFEVWEHMRCPDWASPWCRLSRPEQAIIAQCRTDDCPVGFYFAQLRSDFLPTVPQMQGERRNCLICPMTGID